jgi:phosphoglycolate phosphatase
MVVRFVIFDFDGALADSVPWLLGVFDELSRCYDFKKLDRSAIDRLRHCGTRQLLAHHEIDSWKLPFLMWHVRLLMRQNITSIKPVPGIEAALQRLATKGFVLGILSSSSRENVRRVLGHGTAALFRYWECDASVFDKGAGLRSLVRAARCTNDEVIFVGGEIRDADAAREAQVAFGAVGWGFIELQALASGDVDETFGDPAELVTKLIRGRLQSQQG